MPQRKAMATPIRKVSAGPKEGPTGPDQDFSAEHHRIATINGNQVEINETSGIAAAEAAGTVGVEEQQSKTGEHPSAG